VKVLVLNCGSSSLKFQLIETDAARAAAGSERLLAKGLVENIGGAAVVKYEAEGKRPLRETGEILEHKIAVERCLGLLTREGAGVLASRDEIDAVGHRVVHGGERFKDSALIDDAVLEGIEDCYELAPLHNPPNVKGYRAAHALLSKQPHVAVFDTSFHQTMPQQAYLYGLPYVLYERHGVRRYGFHGTSHRFVSERLAAALGRKADDASLRLITCHLGNGCSIAAIRGGRSQDTSMGFTPLEGLLMGTRSGDLDPAILPHVMAKEELGASEIQALLNKHSGLLGVSGVSNDMRALLASSEPSARLAVDYFVYRAAKEIGALTAALGGLDALVFTAGIGENSAEIRKRICAASAWLGIELDEEANARRAARITTFTSKVSAWMIPTNEEQVIARHTGTLLGLVEAKA
jgi:acetate kinase